ncbi:hypothetical protein ILUMI_09641 [Ignelater luminosus]|uniref:HTH psq-type domain-containing protein n=1 Tax=Ignelater luminosus TaxID=2038154 RepID=A0A8K0GEC1_IGNLU|nr:hypothetical protein ILUMI_09641 [Ignelater luminosus]
MSFGMVRTCVRKTKQGQWTQENMRTAADKVLSKQVTIRKAAEIYNVPYSLQRLSPGLANRLTYLAGRGFGITPKAVRKYTFEFVECQNIKHKFNKKSGMAEEDWFHRFMKRNQHLSIRKPEGLPRARINGMKKEKVAEFYKTLENMVEENDFRGKPECVYNVDETGMPLNNQPPDIIAKKGSKDVVSMTSVERGQNVTVLACMNATGQFIPPFVLFKGVRKRHDFMIGMPSGTEKGWVTEEACQSIPDERKTWQNSHTNMGITKVAFGGLFKQAWNQAATIGNATKGFEKTGIFPLNANAIPDHKFIGDTLDQDGNTPESNDEQQLDNTLPSVAAEQVNDEQPSTTHQRVEDTQSPTCSK